MNEVLRPEIRSLVEYTLHQYPHRIKLNQNENPFELPADIKREVLERLNAMSWSRYPAFIPQEQLDLLASFTGWKSDGVLLGNGSNDLLQLIFTCVLEKGRSVVLSQPTFTLYKLLGQSLGANVIDVPMHADLSFDVDEIIKRATSSNASLIVVCSPNNPTGSFLAREEIIRIIESTKALVVLDEAYVQFARETQIPLLARYERLVILQTFSKAMGAAGLRFGYALMNPDLAKSLSAVKLPYSVNIFTLLAAEVFMTKWDLIKGWIGTITSERERVRTGIGRMPTLKVYPSEANFLLFETFMKTPAQIFDAVLSKGILIRNVSAYPMLDKALRVSVGTPEENSAFLSALQEAL